MTNQKEKNIDPKTREKIQEIDLSTLEQAVKSLEAEDEELQKKEAEQAAKQIES